MEIIAVPDMRRRRGRPPRVPLDPIELRGINPSPQSRDAFFDLGDRLLLLEKAGHAQEEMGRALGLSQPTVSRLIKAAAWPAGIRARILLAGDEKFPVAVLMRLARKTWKDEGRVTKDGRRQVMKSRITLRAAVDLVIEGKYPFNKITESGHIRAKRMERLMNEERSARQAQQVKIEELEAENRNLKSELSIDKYSHALRRCRELEAEVLRLSSLPGDLPAQKEKSEDLKRADAATAAALGLGPTDVDTLEWSEGLMLVRARSGDVLDGLREKLSWLPMIRPKNGRLICQSCRGMIGL